MTPLYTFSFALHWLYVFASNSDRFTDNLSPFFVIAWPVITLALVLQHTIENCSMVGVIYSNAFHLYF